MDDEILTGTRPEAEAPVPDDSRTRREIALEEMLEAMRAQQKQTDALIKELKIQNEKLILSMPVADEPTDDELFSIFDKYQTKR